MEFLYKDSKYINIWSSRKATLTFTSWTQRDKWRQASLSFPSFFFF